MKSPKTFVRKGRHVAGCAGFVRGKSLVALVPLVCFLLVSFGASADMVPSNSGGAGTFDGVSAGANQATGAAGASYEFQLFPVRDVQPTLRLVYSTSTDAAFPQEAGHAWGLDIPIVERRPLQGGAPTFEDGERMTFSGQPLVFIGDVGSTSVTMLDGTTEQLPPWSVGTRYYRLQNDAHMRFFWSRDRLTWTVQSPSGITMEFGRPTKRRGENDDAIDWADAFGHIHRWRLVRQYDAHTGVVVYHWNNLGRRSEEMPVLTDIYDTPIVSSNSLVDFAHHTHIAYEATPTAGDPALNTVGYAPIWKQKYQVRIKRVDVAGKGLDISRTRAVVRRYHLGYTMQLRRSMLTSIALEGAACASALEVPIPPGPHGGTSDFESPETNCPRLPATEFTYSTPIVGPAVGGLFRRDPNHPPPDKMFPAYRVITLMDLDRNGTSDFVLQPRLGVKETAGVYLNPANSAPYFPLNFNQLVKANGDVLASNAGFSLVDSGDLTNTASVLWRDKQDATPTNPNKLHHRLRVRADPLNGVYTWTDPVAQGRIPGGVVAVGDVDGSGTPDLLETHPVGTSTSMVTRVSLGQNYKMASGHADVNAIPDRKDVASSIGYKGDVPFWALADLNGDGLDDLVTLHPKPGASGEDYKGQRLIYYPGDGTGNFACDPARTKCHVPTEQEGKVLTKAPWVDMPSTSNEQYPVEMTWNQWSTYPFQFADLNRDGLTDVYQPERRGESFLHVWLNQDGTLFHEIHPQSTDIGVPDATRVLSGDFDADGALDIAYLSYDDAAVERNAEGGFMSFFKRRTPSEPAMPGLLMTIENELHATTSFTYATLHELEVEAQSNGEPWTYSAPVPMYVVTLITQQHKSDFLATSYKYGNPAYDRFEHRVVGFREVESKTSRGSIVHTKYYFGRCFERDEDFCTETSEVQFEKPFTGLPYQTEIRSRDGSAVYSTNVMHYKVMRLYNEPGGLANDARRSVAFSYPDAVDTYPYDTAPFVAQKSYLFPKIVEDSRVATVVVSLASGPAFRARLRREQVQDALGNVRETRDLGHIADDGSPIEPIIKTSFDVQPVGDANLFAFRPMTVTLSGNGVEPDRVQSFMYTPEGEVTDIYANLSGTLPLVRFHEKGADIAPPPPGASGEATTVHIAHFNYAYGFLQSGWGPGFTRCFFIRPDDYLQKPRSMERYTKNCAGVSFADVWTYESKFEEVGTAFPSDGSIATTRYDEFGRTRSAGGNDPDLPGVPSTPSVFTYLDTRTTRIESPNDIHTPTITSWHFQDGFGQPLASVLTGDPAAGDPPWIVQNAVRYTEARPDETYRPYGTDVDPSTRTFPYRSGSADGQITYDSFGRVVGTKERGRQTATKYHALSVDRYDHEDLTGGAHANTPSTVTTDGHGRVVSSIVRTGSDVIETKLEYNLAGQVTKITKSQGSRTFVRWMKYDTLGRLVLNAEPNTSKAFIANPNDPAAITAMRAWRYAYDDAGRLIGTSDARGCGKNIFYDSWGRVRAEDYSPCLANHEPYTPIDLATGSGAETVYEYDTPGPLNSLAYVGRLTSVADRGAITHFGYDARGRIRQTARRITRPASNGPTPETDSGGLDAELGTRIHLGGSDEDAAPDRYTPHVYKKSFGYDILDRLTVEDSGADVPELRGPDGQSIVGYAYNKRGQLTSVNSSYGPLIKSITYNTDGTPRTTKYDDAAITTVDMQYGDHDLAKYTISHSRLEPLVLADLDFQYDGVGNPTAINDKRDPAAWPEGAKPRTQVFEYDDLYRLTHERSLHVAGGDKQVSPFAKEESTGNATMVPRLARGKRSTGFDIAYDFMGNTTALSDNDATVLDRAHLGTTIINGDPGGHPNQLRLANAGLEARYDDAGNVVELRVSRLNDCSRSDGRCSHRIVYDWDEIGQLVRARRWDFRNLSDDATTYPEVPSGTPAADVRYAYSQGQRVLRSAKGATTPERHSVEVFGSLRLDNAAFTSGDYEVNSATESVYLGGGLAHVIVTEDNLPSASSSKQHVFMTIGDRLGSTSIVIDKNTGELAESIAYHPYGTVDSDYRPERWGSHREVYQFTGKEADIDVGLTYFGARYYSTGLARWLSADPLTVHAMGSDLNPYAYVGGHAMQATDPTGLCYECGPAFGGGPWTFPPSLGSGPGSDAGGGGVGGDGGTGGNGAGKGFLGYREVERLMTPPPPPAVAATGPATGSFNIAGYTLQDLEGAGNLQRGAWSAGAEAIHGMAGLGLKVAWPVRLTGLTGIAQSLLDRGLSLVNDNGKAERDPWFWVGHAAGGMVVDFFGAGEIGAVEKGAAMALEGAAQEVAQLGGAHSKVRAAATEAGLGGQVHHTPSWSATEKAGAGVSYGNAPSLWMQTADHLKTPSFGRGPLSAEFRAQQQMLIENGRYLDAVKMDVDSIRTLFGNKYDGGIQQLGEYIWRMGQ